VRLPEGESTFDLPHMTLSVFPVRHKVCSWSVSCPGQRASPAQVPGPTLLREPKTSTVGKRYKGFPSTNSPVNTPTYGAASTGARFGFGMSSEAHPAIPIIRSAHAANALRA
jgi:hypothetical protein